MNLTLYSPTETITLEIAWLEINTPGGNCVIQKGHAPMIATLVPHKPFIYRLKTGKQESITIRHGVVEIDREQATIVFNTTDLE